METRVGGCFCCGYVDCICVNIHMHVLPPQSVCKLYLWGISLSTRLPSNPPPCSPLLWCLEAVIFSWASAAGIRQWLEIGYMRHYSREHSVAEGERQCQQRWHRDRGHKYQKSTCAHTFIQAYTHLSMNTNVKNSIGCSQTYTHGCLYQHTHIQSTDNVLIIP